jgi:hypothetical protein
VKLGDVSGRIACEYFVAEVLDQFCIPVRASGYDFVALFAKSLVRDIHVSEIIPEGRIFAQSSKARFPLILHFLLVRDLTLRKLRLLAGIFSQLNCYRNPSCYTIKT